MQLPEIVGVVQHTQIVHWHSSPIGRIPKSRTSLRDHTESANPTKIFESSLRIPERFWGDAGVAGQEKLEPSVFQ